MTDCWARDASEAVCKRIWFRLRVLHDVADINTATTILGHKVNVPLVICPTGLARVRSIRLLRRCWRAPRTGPGVGRGVVIEILSTSDSHTLEDIVREAEGWPVFFQLYVNKDRRRTEELLAKVKLLGFKSIFVNIDAPGRGKRESDERLAVDVG